MAEFGFEPNPDELLRQSQDALRAGNGDHAIELLTQAINLAPANATAEGLLGAAYSQKGMLVEAIQHTIAAIHLSPGQASLRYNLAVLYQRAGDDTNARGQYEAALQIDPGHERARQGLIGLGGIAPPAPAAAPMGGAAAATTRSISSANCQNHPTVAAAHFCGSCGKPLCAQCERQSFGLILCAECLTARQAGAAEMGGAAALVSAPGTPGTLTPVAGRRILRPLGFGDLFDEAFDLYRSHFTVFLGIVALVGVPALILGLATRGSGLASLVFIANVIGSLLASGALTKGIAESYLARPISIGGCYSFFAPRLLAYFFTELLSWIAIGGAFFVVVFLSALLIAMLGPLAGGLLMIGLFVMLMPLVLSFFLVAPVFVVDNLRYMAALNRCWSLTQGHRMRLFSIALVMGLLIMAVYVALLIPASLVLGPVMQAGRFTAQGEIAMNIAGTIIQLLIGPIYSTILILFYFDLRVRKEGLDIQMLTDNVAAWSR